MARISPLQVTNSSVDSSGLSVTVARRRADDPRYGVAYDLAHLAAAVPIYFHPLAANEYLMVFNRRWHTATSHAQNPGFYTSITEEIGPGWIKLSVPGGSRSMVNGSYGIALRTPADTVRLVDAVSRSSVYLYLLMSATTGTKTTGVVAHWVYNSTTGSFSDIAEDSIPGIFARPEPVTRAAWIGLNDEERAAFGNPVVFDKGLWLLNQHLIVFGTDTQNRLMMARKPWGKIGDNRAPVIHSSYQSQREGNSEDPRWTYWTEDGWIKDWKMAEPLTDSSGAVITSLGPVSVATYRHHSLLATVTAQGDERLAQIYAQVYSLGWTPSGTVPLGSVADNSYLDNLRWQQQVPPALAQPEMTADGNEAAIPYIVSRRETVTVPVPPGSPVGTQPSVRSSLRNDWALWPILRKIPASQVDRTALDGSLVVTARSQGIVNGIPIGAGLSLGVTLDASGNAS